MKSLKIPKGQSESVYRRTDNNSYLMDIGPQQSLRFSDRNTQQKKEAQNGLIGCGSLILPIFPLVSRTYNNRYIKGNS